MKIVKHKDISLSPEMVMRLSNGEIPIPAGVTVDVTEDAIVVQPEHRINLFGLYGEEGFEDYEIIYFEEENDV